jgi:hypothetical protein
MLGAAGLLAIGAAGGGAYAASSTTDPQDALLDDAAKRLDVSPEKLRSALEDAFAAQLDQAVTDGKLTQKQADRIKEHGLPPFGGPGLDERHGHIMVGPGLDGAADYLGLSDQQLRTRLMRGRSLAQIAKAQGKSVDGLEQALVDAATKRLDEAVDAGDLTAEQRDEMLSHLKDHVDELVQGKGPGPGGPRFERRFGHGFGGPPPPPGEWP